MSDYKDLEDLDLHGLLTKFRQAKTHKERKKINELLSDYNITMQYSCDEVDPLSPKYTQHKHN